MSRALIVVHGQRDRQRAATLADKVPAGTRIEFKAAKRTLPQNDLMWSRLTEVSRQVEWYGQKLPPADWKDIFTAALRTTRVVPGIDPGTFVLLGLHTSDMSKGEMADLLDLIDAFAAEHGVMFNEEQAA